MQVGKKAEDKERSSGNVQDVSGPDAWESCVAETGDE